MTWYKVELESKKVVVKGNIMAVDVLESICKVKNAQLWSSSWISLFPHGRPFHFNLHLHRHVILLPLSNYAYIQMHMHASISSNLSFCFGYILLVASWIYLINHIYKLMTIFLFLYLFISDQISCVYMVISISIYRLIWFDIKVHKFLTQTQFKVC